MKNIFKYLPFIMLILFLTSCSDAPSSDLKEAEFNKIRETVKDILGDDYDAENFEVKKEGFANEEKTEYIVDFTFDLNKPYTVYEGKNIESELRFEKEDDQWECTYNSANVMGLFNLLKIN